MNRSTVWDYLQQQSRHPAALLLPLRLFIGIGWIRAGLEKVIDPFWLDGTALVVFLRAHLEQGAVVFPFYESLISGVFIPHALLLTYVIIVGQMLAGVSILTGVGIELALLGGMFMNLNFLFAGAVNPSVFYIVIQLVLLLYGAGHVFSIRALLAHQFSATFTLGKADKPRISPLVYHSSAILALGLLGGLALYAFPLIEDFGPTRSVEDPAMITVVLSVMGILWVIIAALRRASWNEASISAPKLQLQAMRESE
jgi:thiosulfate dehydrogenase (quinone) large subunit